METEINEVVVAKINEIETEGIAIKKELTNIDVLICGLCHLGFHYIEEFQEHKSGECTNVSVFRNNTTKENRPKVLGFLLWKYSQTTVLENIDESKVYKIWSDLPEAAKNCWIQAGLTISGFDELAKTIPDKLIKIKPENGSTENDLPPEVMKPSGEFPINKEFVVERVIARRFNQKKNEFEYLLKWEGYPPEQNTWEPLDNISDYSHLIEQYEDSLVMNGTNSNPGKKTGPGHSGKIEQTQTMEVDKPKVESPQAQVEQVEIEKRPVRVCKQKAVDQVKYWCGTKKATEEIIEKPSQLNVLKRDHVSSKEEEEDKDTPVLKKKCFQQDSEVEDLDDPPLHKSIVPYSENEEPNHGTITTISKLTIADCIKYNISRIPSKAPVSNEEDWVEKIKTHLAQFNTFYRNSDASLLKFSSCSTEVILASTKGLVKLKTKQVPLSGMYIFSHTEGFTRLSIDNETQRMMMMMTKKDDRNKANLINNHKVLQSPKKVLDMMKARETVIQSSPLLKPYVKKTFVTPNVKVQAAVKHRKVTAPNPEYEKSLLPKYQNSPGMKSNRSDIKFVTKRTLNTIGGQQDIEIPPVSPKRPLTLCPVTGKRLMKAEGEKTPEPTPPSSPMLSEKFVQYSNSPNMIKIDSVIGNIGNQNRMISIGEPEKLYINSTPQMQHYQPTQSFVDYKNIPAASNSGLLMNNTNSRANNINEFLYVNSGVTKCHGSLNVPALELQQNTQNQQKQVTQKQPSIMIDESGRYIVSADNEHSIITITGDDGMLYEVSAAQLAMNGGTVLLTKNDNGDGPQYVSVTDNGNGVMQDNQNQEGIALDGFGNSVDQSMASQSDLDNLVIDKDGNVFMKDNETGQYVPASATEEGGNIVIQTIDNFVQEPQVQKENSDLLIATLVDAGEPNIEDGSRRILVQLPDGSLVQTDMNRDQYAALEAADN